MLGFRSLLRWLSAPLLRAIDRRIARSAQELDVRISRAEREIDAMREYGQLLAGALTPPTRMEQAEQPPGVDGAKGSTVEIAKTASSGATHFLDRLSCPVCRSHVRIVPELVTTDGRIKRGYVPCEGCQELIAVVRNFRVDFRVRGGTPAAHPKPARIIPAVGEMRIPCHDPRLRRVGDWTFQDERFAISHGLVTDSLEYRGRFTDALVHLLVHPDGGIVDFFIDGRHSAVADSYSADWFVLPFTVASDLPPDQRVLRIQPRGTKNAAAAAADVYVAEVVLLGPRTDQGFEEPLPMNRGNPYMDVFERYISQVPAEELVLEVGGGERRRLRPGYVNLEHLPFESADVYGDILHLPFQDGTFTLVLAQAVFEHVTNPHAAAAELMRVSRQGGLIVIDAAFMQPLHAAPHHYFNMTHMGIRELFKACAIVELDHYDGLASTIDWMLRSVGAQAKVTEEQFASVIDGVRAMEARLSHEDIRPAASGFWLVARNPD